MKLKLITTLAATSLVALCLSAQVSSAAPPKQAAEKSGGGGVGVLPKTIPMPVYAGLKFGMSLEQVAKLNDKDLDAEFKKRFLAASPTETLSIDEELRDKKAAFRRGRITFDDTPTGIDQSALKGEYSYGNKESLKQLSKRTRDDGKEIPARNYFFFNDKLWKIYEEHQLGPKASLGENFDAAVAKLSKVFGAAPVKLAADFQNDRPFDEALWRDGEKYIRAVDRGNVVGLVFVEKSVQDSLAKMRPNKLVDQHELDKDVKAATANPPTQITGPKEPEKDKKGAKKK
jgi:hypothetical protein